MLNKLRSIILSFVPHVELSPVGQFYLSLVLFAVWSVEVKLFTAHITNPILAVAQDRNLESEGYLTVAIVVVAAVVAVLGSFAFSTLALYYANDARRRIFKL